MKSQSNDGSQDPDADRLLTAEQVASWLNIDRRSVYTLDLHRVKIGKRRVRFEFRDVQDFITKQRALPKKSRRKTQ